MPTISTLVVDVQAKTSKFSSGIKIAVGGLATLAAGAAYAFGKFEESDKIAAQTNAVLKSTGGAAHITAQQVGALADALSLKSGVDDEAVQSGENLLLTFRNVRNEVGKGNDIFNQATTAALDMSVALGTDMKSAAMGIGKALNDPVKGLTRLTRMGVSFTDQQVKQVTHLEKTGHALEAQKVILGELTKEFSGSAQAQATQSAKMSVAFENLAEAAGKVLAPAINAALQGITIFIAWLQVNVPPAFKVVRDWFVRVWERVGPFVEIIGHAAVKAFTQINASLGEFVPQLKKLYTSIQPLLKVLGILVGVLLILALKVLPITVKATLAVDTVLIGIIGVLSNVTGAVVRFIGRLVGFFRDLPHKLAAAAHGMWDFIWKGLRSAANIAVGLINGLIDTVNRFQIHVHAGLGPLPDLNVDWGGLGIPHIPSLFKGGTVMRTGFALVHEGERFSGVQGGWGGVTVNVYGSVMTERDLADTIQRALLREKRRSGALGLS